MPKVFVFSFTFLHNFPNILYRVYSGSPLHIEDLKMEQVASESHKRPRVSKSTKENASQNVDDAKLWKNKYLEMCELKDEAESDIKALFALKKETEVALLDKIKVLEEANAVHLGISCAASETSSKQLENIIKFYEQMTGMKVSHENDQMICKMTNKSKRKFSKFSISTQEDEMTFRPMINAMHFPEYMHSVVAFNTELAPTLMSDALSSIFDDEE
jgi:Asp-tRNA(Asn)/Glu-tRNA(Gln) amidotransferase C subunit